MKTRSNSLFQFFIKIVLPSLLALILFILTLFYIVIPVFDQAMMDRKREMIRELTNSATSILEKYHKDEQEGILTREEAQQTAISRIQYLRYGDENKDYFWITDMHPTMVMHPYKPELNGTDLTNYEDSHGKKMFAEFVRVVSKDGHGFVDYMWQWKDDSTHIVPKLSYVKKFEPWNWIIGTGIYIEDVRKEISALTARLTYISIIISALTLILLTFISIQSFRIERKRQLAENSLKESREKYRSLVEASTEGLVMVSDNEIIFSNSVFQEMTGMNEKNIAAQRWNNLFILPQHIIDKIELNQEIETPPFETSIKLSGDKTLQVLITITPMIVYGKKAVIFSVKDISSDLQIKQQLFESRERFKTLMDKLNVGIFRTTIDARGRFLEANETAIRLLGFEEHEQLRDKYIIDLLADQEDKRNFRKKLLKTGFIKNQVIQLIRRDGFAVSMMVSLAVITDEDGQAAWCDGIIEPLINKNIEEKIPDASFNIDDLRTLLQNQPVQSLIQPLQTAGHSMYLQDAIQLTEDNNHPYLIITDRENQMLGYITETEMLHGLKGNITSDNIKLFQVMKSPLHMISSDSTRLVAEKMFQKTGSPLLIVIDDSGNPSGVITKAALYEHSDLRLGRVLSDMENAVTIKSLEKLYSEFTGLISGFIITGISEKIVLQLLSAAFNQIISSLFGIAFRELGQPAVRFAFIVPGSEGRSEQTLSTDQDNAIIFDDNADQDARNYFLKLGTWICRALDNIGFTYCKGDIMAMNSKWNQPLSIWKTYFSNWINTGHAKDLLDINIFFDYRHCYGSQELSDELQQHITAVSEATPAYLHLMARNTIQNKLSVSDQLNLKDGISAAVNFVRIYALQNSVVAKNTISRLKMLVKLEVMKETSAAEIEKALDFLTSLRLKHQATLILEGRKAGNTVEFKQLTEFEQAIVKKALSTISTAMTKLNFDFRLGI